MDSDALLMEISRLTEVRSKIYEFISAVYITPPDGNFLKSVRDAAWPYGALNALRELPKSIAHGLWMIDSIVNIPGRSVEELRAKISVEFTRLFRGLRRHGPPPPYESVYREGLCWGESTTEVLAEYSRLGLTVRNEHKGEPPDHISFELDFMRFLCEKEAEAWRKDNSEEALMTLDGEKRFLSEHLSKWVGEFCGNIRRYDTLGFYQYWADVTEGWISFDLQQIDYYKAVVCAYGGSLNL